MIGLRGFAVVVCATCAVAAGQSSPEPVPQAPVVASGEDSAAVPSARDAEREALRADFIQARSEFARVTAAALTSDELTNWVRGISQRVRLRRTEEDLWDVRAALDRISRSGHADAERVERLAAREAELAREVERLCAPAAAAPASGFAMPSQATVRHWIEREMGEETSHLADTLTDRELARRTRRLHRLATLAQFARRFRDRRRGPQAIPQDDGEIFPAGGVETPSDNVENADFAELGKPTTVPPKLSEPAPEKGTTPDEASADDADDNAEERDAPAEEPAPQP